MVNIDDWLSSAAARTSLEMSSGALATLERQLDKEMAPIAIAARRNAQRTMVCGALAAAFAFVATGTLMLPQAPARPMWLASPSASSPYSLLIGN
ncbi:hypothetical protein WSK_0194 [Novosphingobium sp. Rr 2-17]|uniref:CnrY/NccY family anti-sigma factor n=1 Tax=Novosphingobium sp. Rr 2-17 TaxID=555793 RepID=UPI0002698179|nr:CnrY/NccY family anti-sigma factor [Novosphingobium sp. Rr 2-17]EIZ81249.1 hypothetical protein WSK_0194 [Novosphingobium sp. Rr 2-17]